MTSEEINSLNLQRGDHILLQLIATTFNGKEIVNDFYVQFIKESKGRLLIKYKNQRFDFIAYNCIYKIARCGVVVADTLTKLDSDA